MVVLKSLACEDVVSKVVFIGNWPPVTHDR